MPTADYTFRINDLLCNQKQSNGNYADNDYVLFSVAVNGQVYSAPACTPPANGSPTAGSLAIIFNGTDTPLWGKQPEDDSWQIGPITIDDQDTVIVFYAITNLSYSDPAAQASQSLQIWGAALAGLGSLLAVAGGIGAAAGSTVGGFGAIPGAVVAVIGGVISLIGGIFSTIGTVIGQIAGNRPNCDGLVVTAPALGFTGAQLEASVVEGGPGPGQFTQTIVDSNLTSTSPKGCSTASTNVTWSILRNIAGRLTTGGGTPPKMAIRMLAASQEPQDWGGKWGDGEFWETSRIQCVVTATGKGPSGTAPQDRVNSYVAGLLHSAQVEPMTVKVLGTPARAVRSSGLAVATLPPASMTLQGSTATVVPVSARYGASIVEHFVSSAGPVAAQLTVANLVEIPMLAEPFTTAVYAQDVLHTTTGGTITKVVAAGSLPAPVPAAGAKSLKEGVPVKTPVDIVAAQVAPLSIAATLAADAQVSLELFGSFDPSDKLVGYRLRHTRTDSAGNVLTDVMLAPVQNAPQ